VHDGIPMGVPAGPLGELVARYQVDAQVRNVTVRSSWVEAVRRAGTKEKLATPPTHIADLIGERA